MIISILKKDIDELRYWHLIWGTTRIMPLYVKKVHCKSMTAESSFSCCNVKMFSWIAILYHQEHCNFGMDQVASFPEHTAAPEAIIFYDH